MEELDDITLLREYFRHNSEQAFAVLVARHVDRVYSVAVRHTGNSHRAEEITQAVFVILARKSRHLTKHAMLEGWLYQTARLTALTYIRSEMRRACREQEVYMQKVLNEDESEVWSQIAPLLDTALAHLNESDRNTVVLRFFYSKSLREIATAQGGSEDAARMRVNRALAKLRKFFVKRGIVSTAATIAGAISENSIQAAPVGLAKAICAAAITKGATAGGSTAALIKGALKIMAWTKLKIVALFGVGLLLVSGTVFVSVKALHPAVPVIVPENIWASYSLVLRESANGSQATAAAIQLMTNYPPMASIRMSPVQQPPPIGIGSVGTLFGHVELNAYLVQVLRYAYGLGPGFPQNRIIAPDNLLTNTYDFIDTMPQGGKEDLQRALKEQFDLVAHRQMRKNLILTVTNPDSGGLHKHMAGTDGFRSRNVTMAMIASSLSEQFGEKVTDQTGLVGGFDYSLKLAYPITPMK